MAYKDRYGSTQITEGKFNNLSIGWEHDNDPSDPSQRYPVFLFVPYMDDHEHSHIELNREQAAILRDWLDDYLNNKPTEWRKNEQD